MLPATPVRTLIPSKDRIQAHLAGHNRSDCFSGNNLDRTDLSMTVPPSHHLKLDIQRVELFSLRKQM